MRDTLFISHATPEDNKFSIWLASRLELMGYKVWLDKAHLLGGEKFWDIIEEVITNNAIKFLLVYSDSICSQKGTLKAGIEKEYNLASLVAKKKSDLSEFIILLKIDNSSHDLFEGSKDLNQIPYFENWAGGLTLLLSKLEKDKIVKAGKQSESDFSKWYLDHFIIKNPIIKKKELYYSNWWKVKKLPEKFFIFKFSNETQAEAIFTKNESLVIVRNANCISTFDEDFSFEIKTDTEDILLNPTEKFEIMISDVLNKYEGDTFPTYVDSENIFKKLLKRVIHVFFKNKKMHWYEFSNKNIAYYHTRVSLPLLKVNFRYPYRSSKSRSKRKQLFGKYLAIGKWHYAISLKPILYPFLGFNIKSHLVFTENGFRTLTDKKLIQSYRKTKGKRMFNQEWRDLLFAFINSLKGEDQNIFIPVNKNDGILMRNEVEYYWSNYGYNDPKDLTRQGIFTYEEEGEEEGDGDENNDLNNGFAKV